ncbi:YbgC/FadM family acyl-CoA thioesterase [Xylophilus sp. ASV27]|uniref:YbgC/FadM family acyl-CoA thioesterase n=1 Tax=Xylophilus sp. ASV27 TaxID=2795129 RepID=UPI0018EB4445|nr:YbgC/FadM family acyl-CoA thioesterase [Xylophilus sp. ASV27]
MTHAAARPADFRVRHRLRVRWAEVDMQKIVFNAHYLMYFDTAVTDYWRALALPYESAMHLLGGELYVKKATLQYHASARMDDLLEAAVRCARIGNSSMGFEGAIFRDGRRLIECELVYVFADSATQTARPVPPALRALLQDFEAGAGVTEVRSGPWAALGAHAASIRTEVFIQEQAIAPEDEWDADDAGAVHAVVYNRLGQPLATGRLLRHAEGVGRVGRMAVLRALRGAHLGRTVLDALLAQARARGDREVILHAQCSAQGFYAQAGFTPTGAPFDEVGIPHIGMRLCF